MLADELDTPPTAEAVAVEVAADAVVPPDDAEQAAVAERIRALDDAARLGWVAYLHQGRDLAEMKRRLRYGDFGAWFDRELAGRPGWSLKTAQRKISAAALIGDRIDTVSNLGIAQATVYRIARKETPEPIKVAFLAALDAGDANAGKVALAAIRAAEAKPERPERTQARGDAMDLLRRRLGRHTDRFADLAEQAGPELRGVARLLREVTEPAGDRPVRRIRRSRFARFQTEMFPGLPDVTEADADRMRAHAEAAARAMPTTPMIAPDIPAPVEDTDAEAEPTGSTHH